MSQQNYQVCPNGHYYDADVNTSCPFCKDSKKNNQVVDIGVTVPAGKTEAGRGELNQGPTLPPENKNTNWWQNTTSSGVINSNIDSQLGKTSRGSAGDTGVTASITPGVNYGPGFVVGWLVCTEGASRGRDFRIHSGHNFIGRLPGNDIYIPGDDAISREKHARISYEPKGKMFLIAPENGRNFVYVNDKALMMPEELKPYDMIQIGDTKLIFIPLCGSSFDWNESK